MVQGSQVSHGQEKSLNSVSEKGVTGVKLAITKRALRVKVKE